MLTNLIFFIQIEFEREEGAHIRNIISEGPDRQLRQLHTTYTFEHLRPNLEEGTEEAEKEHERLTRVVNSSADLCFESMQ